MTVDNVDQIIVIIKIINENTIKRFTKNNKSKHRNNI